MWRGPKHVRTRLTLWYVVVLGFVLLVFIGTTSVALFGYLWTQLSRHAVMDLETVEGLLYFDAEGTLQVRDDYHNHPESRLVLERLLEIRSPDGTVLHRNERLGDQALGGPLFPGEGEGGYSNRSTRLADGTRAVLVSRRHLVNGRPTVIRLAYSEEPLWRGVKEWLYASLLALPLVLVLTGFAGHRLARRALEPIERMARRAEEITPERLHERLPIGEVDDEMAYLARVFNQLLQRLEHSFGQLRRFTSDASHELRTPLAAIRSVGEVGLQHDATPEQYRDVIGSMLEEVDRLTSLADNLLEIARADTGAVTLHSTVFPVFGLVREATGLVEVLIEDKGQELVLSGAETATVAGDRVFLRQALVNVVHNAVKYSPVGGTIRVRVRHELEDQVMVEVADSGPGIPREHFPKLFDRFYRVEDSRSREAGGAGLGLSIAKWAVEAHGGTIDVESNLGEGSVFRITLPTHRMSA